MAPTVVPSSVAGRLWTLCAFASLSFAGGGGPVGASVGAAAPAAIAGRTSVMARSAASVARTVNLVNLTDTFVLFD